MEGGEGGRSSGLRPSAPWDASGRRQPSGAVQASFCVVTASSVEWAGASERKRAARRWPRLGLGSPPPVVVVTSAPFPYL